MTQLHIAFAITRADSVGGATIHVRDLASALLAAGHRATVLVAGRGAVTDQLEAARIPFVSLRYLRRSVHPLHDFLAVHEMRRALTRLRPHLVSAHTAKAGCIARLAAAGSAIPVLYTPHGWTIGDRISRTQGFIYRQIERRTAPLSAAIVNVCEYERRLAMRHRVGTPNLHRVIYNGMPDVAARLRAKLGLEPCRIIMVARFEEPKDHATLIDALAGLREFPWDLDLVGDGPGEAAIRRQVESRGLAGRIHFRGTLPSAAPALADAQLFVLSTRSEGFPRSILEAMRAGLPVVASDVGGVSESVTNGRTGYTVPRQSVESLRNALALLLADPLRRAAFGKAGRRAYEQQFTFDRMFAETLDTYHELTGAPVVARARKRSNEWQPQLR